jgi:histone-lysine N-methyltransferase SETMAR
VHQVIQNKKSGKVSKMMILLHDNAHPHMANLATVGQEIMNYPPYSPKLASSDFYLFGPMTVDLGGQKFQTDDELKLDVLNWLCSWYKAFYAAGISNLPGWKVILA